MNAVFEGNGWTAKVNPFWIELNWTGDGVIFSPKEIGWKDNSEARIWFTMHMTYDTASIINILNAMRDNERVRVILTISGRKNYNE